MISYKIYADVFKGFISSTENASNAVQGQFSIQISKYAFLFVAHFKLTPPLWGLVHVLMDITELMGSVSYAQATTTLMLHVSNAFLYADKINTLIKKLNNVSVNKAYFL